MVFENLPRAGDRIVTNCTREDREVVMKNAQLNISDEWRGTMEASHDTWIVYSLNNEFVYDNPAHRRLVGLPEDFDCEGMYISEPKVPCYEVCSADFIEHNQLGLKNEECQILDIHPIGDTEDWYCYLFKHSPLINKDNQKTGVLAHGQPILQHWQDSMKALMAMQRHYTGENQVSMQVDSIERLTQHQAEVLFFLLCRVEPKRIGRYLNVTESAIDKTVDRMRRKLDCGSTSQLVEKVVCMDWHKLIPQRLLGDKQVSMVLD